MSQGVGPEFKPQYWPKKKKKPTLSKIENYSHYLGVQIKFQRETWKETPKRFFSPLYYKDNCTTH
jgi:hypothetical protein